MTNMSKKIRRFLYYSNSKAGPDFVKPGRLDQLKYDTLLRCLLTAPPEKNNSQNSQVLSSFVSLNSPKQFCLVIVHRSFGHKSPYTCSWVVCPVLHILHWENRRSKNISTRNRPQFIFQIFIDREAREIMHLVASVCLSVRPFLEIPIPQYFYCNPCRVLARKSPFLLVLQSAWWCGSNCVGI